MVIDCGPGGSLSVREATAGFVDPPDTCSKTSDKKGLVKTVSKECKVDAEASLDR